MAEKPGQTKLIRHGIVHYEVGIQAHIHSLGLKINVPEQMFVFMPLNNFTFILCNKSKMFSFEETKKGMILTCATHFSRHNLIPRTKFYFF